MCTDITKIKELESQNKKVRSKFFSSVAHELRTPLNSIIPILDILISFIQACSFIPGEAKEKILKKLKIVRNSAIHLSSVIEDALDVSRIENNKFELNKAFFNIRKTVKEVYEIMQFQTEQKGLGMDLALEDAVPEMVYNDEKRFKQILFNLIGNAIKFTFSGVITIKIQYQAFTNELKVAVKDTGVGIKQEDLSKLFQFFG
jgi:signal transduction histidine kinase